MNVAKRILAELMAVVLIIGLVPATARAAEGDGGSIKLGNATWKSESEYSYPNAEVSFPVGKVQFIFSITVDEDGSFVIPEGTKGKFVENRQDTQIFGIKYGVTKDQYVDNGNFADDIVLSSLTVATGRGITEADVAWLLRNLEFHRNSARGSTRQNINVATSGVQLEDNMSVMMGLDNKLHYYRYVTYNSLGLTQPYDWYTAYAEAKKSRFDGMKGYLATVTNEIEQQFIYDSLGGKKIDLRAWIGGARTLTPAEGAKFTWDADSFGGNQGLVPIADNGQPVQNWYWMCGPEKGTRFFERASMDYNNTDDGKIAHGSGNDGKTIYEYTGWNRMSGEELNGEAGGATFQNSYEPNNYSHADEGYKDPYPSQEYVLEFGFYKANWNDFNPHEPHINHVYGTNGFIIEYSEYGDEKATTPTTKENKEVYNPSANISAKDFVVEKGTFPSGDAEGKDAFIDTYAQIEAFDSTGKKLEQDKISWTDSKETYEKFQKAASDLNDPNLGDYVIKVEATSGSNSTPAVVTATVTQKADHKTDNDGNKKSIGANDFEMSLAQAKAYVGGKPGSEDMLKKLAHATAIENGIKESDLSKIEIISPNTILPKVTGDTPYQVTFRYGSADDDPKVTVNVTVKDNGVPTDGDVTDVQGINLTANDVELVRGDAEITDLATLKTKILKKAEASARELGGTPLPEGSITIPDGQTNLDDIFDMVHNKTLDPSARLIVVQAKQGNKIVETEITVSVVAYPLIRANDFITDKTESSKMDTEAIKAAAAANRYTKEGDTEPSNNDKVQVKAVDNKDGVTDFKDRVANGDRRVKVTFEDTLTGADKAGDVTVNAIVMDDSDRIIDENNKINIAIGANDFEISEAQVEAYNNAKKNNNTSRVDAMLKILANAIATDDGKVVAREDIKVKEVTFEGEDPHVTFTYTKDDKTVEATAKITRIRDEGAPADGINPYRPDPANIPEVNLTASDVELSIGSIKNETLKDDVKTEADPHAKDSDGSVIPVSDINVVTNDPLYKALEQAVADKKPGEYPVNLTTTSADGKIPATTEIKVILTGVDANDFIVGLDELPNLKDPDIINAAGAGIKVGNTIDPNREVGSVDWEKLKSATEPGKLDDAVTFNEAKGDSNPKSVDVTVVDRSAKDDDKKIKIGANDIVITEAEAKNLEGKAVKVQDNLKDLMGVVATEDGDKVSFYKIGMTSNSIKPEYRAEGYPVTFNYNGVEVTAYAKVIKEQAITAKDFGIDGGSPELSEDDFKTKAEVATTDETGADNTDKAKVDTDDLKKLNDAIKNKVPGVYEVKVSTPDGKKTETVKVTVKDPVSTTPSPGDTVGEDRVYEISNPQDIPQDLDTGKTVDRVTIDGVPIKSEDYVVDGGKIAIKPSAMTDKQASDTPYPVAIIYTDGTKKTFNVKVVDYDPTTVVPLKKIPIFNMQKDIGVGKKFKLNLVGMNPNAYIDPKNTKTSNKKIATIDPKTLVIKAKKRGKCNIQAAIIQNGSYYSVKIKLVVKKKMTMYNLKNAALVKQEGTLPEFNVYKRVVKGKKTKLKFTQVSKDAKVTYTSSNKKVATISNKGVIKGKKKGFTKITAKIEQEGHVYYTRLFVRVDDGTKNKQLKKYLTTKVK